MADIIRPDAPVEEGRFGFGTTPAFDGVLKELSQKPGAHTAFLAVNLATLLRNHIASKDIGVADGVKRVKKMMEEMADEFSQLCSQKWPDHTHHILYYLTYPEKGIPPEFVRPRTSPTAVLHAAAANKLLTDLKEQDQTEGNVSAHVRLAPHMKVPSYKRLIASASGIVPSDVEIELISHMPLDYHMTYSSGRAGNLFRSHTGKIVKMTPSNLGEVVFGVKDVPFYPNIHVAMGDKHLIKGSLTRDQRKMFLEAASKGHWGVRTNMYITTKLKDYKIQLPYSLN